MQLDHSEVSVQVPCLHHEVDTIHYNTIHYITITYV